MIDRTDDVLLTEPRFCREVEIVTNGFVDVHDNTIPFQIIMNGLSNQEKMTIERMEIQAFSVRHKESTKVHGIGKRIFAFGYVINYNNQRVVISGDTGLCQSLKKLVENADLAILEASAKEKTAKISNVHLSIEEATEIGKTAKEFILSHQWL